jgi:hypothetical protein
MELAQETVGEQTEFTELELMQLEGYRIQAKTMRASLNRVNPFNLFLKENKTTENESLAQPAPDSAYINIGRPSFTGAYQEHKLRKPESR